MAGHSTRCAITESGADMPKGVVVAETRLAAERSRREIDRAIAAGKQAWL